MSNQGLHIAVKGHYTACMLRIVRITPGFAALLCLLGILLPQPGAARTLVLNTDGAPPHSRPDDSGFEDRIMHEACRRLGLDLRIVRLPSERALKSANDGVEDGNFVRVSGISLKYPNLLMVPEPMSEFPFTVFTRDPDFKSASWDDLRSRNVASVIGWKLVDKHLAGSAGYTQVRDEEALFALLAKGRVEAVVSGLFTGQEVVRRNGYQGVRPVLPSLANPPMYVYLHRRNAELVPRLAEVLRQMRREGVLQRLTKSGLDGVRP